MQTKLFKTAGIIAEYNPLHNGHLYHIAETRRRTGADYITAVISGHFVQRGEPAIYDTYARAEMALLAGADAVFEMPAPFSASSAEDFASYGVGLLSSLGVRYISFGTEGASEEELLSIAELILEESDDYKRFLKNRLASGDSYPAARLAALLYRLNILGADTATIRRTEAILSSPNNILGLEYMKAKLRTGTPIQPVAIDRLGSGYNDDKLNPDGGFSSASAIRREIFSKQASGGKTGEIPEFYHAVKGFITDSPALKSAVPGQVYEMMQNLLPVSPDAYTGAVYRRIIGLLHDGIGLDGFLDVSPDIANRIENNIRQLSSYEELVSMLKTRQLTYTRISRVLCHILLGIKSSDMRLYKSGRPAPYARLIGFKRDSAPLLGMLKTTSSVPIISKLADASDILDEIAFRLLMDEVYASEVYNSVYFDTYKKELPGIYTRQPVII